MASKGGPKREGIVNAVTVAITSSKLKSLADRATLKSVVAGQYLELVKDEKLNLQVLWNLLKDLPGFSKDDAKGAFCLLKTWQSDFHLEVEMPEELESLSDTEVDSAAAYCHVTASKKAQAFDPDTVAVQPRASTSSGARSSNPRSSQGKYANKSEGSSKGLITVLILVLLAGGGFTLYKSLQGDGNAVAINQISADLPIKSATRKGAELTVKLNGDDWFMGDKAERKRAMENTLKSVADIQIDTVMVYDSIGNYRASAMWFGQPPVVAVRLKN